MSDELTLQEVAAMLPTRPDSGHKGTFGHLLALVGSRGFTGAVKLVCNAAYRSGVGLVTAAVPASLSDLIASSLIEPMTLALESTEKDSVAYTALDAILEFARGKSALVMGPGLSTHSSTTHLVRRIYAMQPLPMVVDADGLNALAVFPSRLTVNQDLQKPLEIVLTPHPGEMSRLTGLEISAIQRNRAEIASHYADLWKVTVVLKGHGTVIAAPDGRVRLCPTGNNGMATGGTGDVLSGIIGALLAQGATCHDAACIGVFVHGLAGDVAAREKTARALIASDVIEALPQAWHALERA
jgi:ADP-dependent NAD(P)H-hydrate dehydratase / NAD(P)H-hydrate epimerase